MVGLLATALIAQGALSASPPTGASADAAVDRAIAYLADRVGPDGCVHGLSDCSNRTTDWTIVAVASAGLDPADWPPGGTSPVTYLRENPEAHAPGNEDREALWRARRLLAVVASGEDPRSFGGVDHVQELRETFSGQFGKPERINDDIFATLALRSAGVPPGDSMLQTAEQVIRNGQAENGGWSWCAIQQPGVSCRISSDMTASAIEALTHLGAARSDHDVYQGLKYLERSRVTSGEGTGCLASQAGDDDPNLASTAWAAMSLWTLQTDARRSPWSPSDRSPVDCLTRHQGSEGGFPPIPGARTGTYTTTQVVGALAGVPHGRAAWPLPQPDATLAVDGTRRVGEPVNLTFPGADHASIRIEGHGFRTGTEVSFTPDRAGSFDLAWVAFDDAGRVRAADGSIQVEEAPTEQDGGDGGSSGSGSSRDDGSSGGSHDDGGQDATEPTPPQVHLRLDRPPERNVSRPFLLNASAADELVVAYRIEWGDGATSGWQDDPRFDHTYGRLGNVTLTASAKDAEGDVGSTEVTVQVVDAAPRIDVSGPDSVNRTQNLTLHADATDPDGPAPSVRWVLPAGNATGPELTTRFVEPGRHTVTAVAEDAAGNVARAERTIRAVNRPPRDVAVDPLAVDANTTATLHATASDPDGDPLAYTWRLGEATETGANLTFDTGPPGNRTLTLNATDPHGGWTRVQVHLRVLADDRPEPAPANGSVTERSHGTGTPSTAPNATQNATENATTATHHREPPHVELPSSIRGTQGLATLLEGTAVQPEGDVTRVQVRVGGDRAVPVEGNSTFTAILPQRLPGTYAVQARAAGIEGTWGPWTNSTLVVEPAADQPLDPTAARTGEDAERPTDALAPLLAAAALAGAAVLGRRRP